MYYLVCPDADFRSRFIAYLREKGIHAVFHYLSLHTSEYYKAKHDGRPLPLSDHYSDCLVRLPLFHDLQKQEEIINAVNGF
jgi:dTDP-4-amino-4,6-dideoxygalactose transaminase